jgi:hypothetical protein
MPKTEIDYSNTIFYKIQCKNPDVKDVYIGHTTNFVQRKHAHKRSCTNATADSYNCKVYNVIREFGGWDNWKMEIIAFRECADHYAARKIEQQYFEEYNATLNSIEPLPKPKVIPPKETQIKPEKQILHCETFENCSLPIKPQTNYNCNACDFNSSNKKDYSRHILSAKHLRIINNTNFTPGEYQCVCGKKYKHMSGLCKHKHKCKPIPSPEENIQTTIEPIAPNSAELLVLVKELMIQMAVKNKHQDELIAQMAAKDKQQDELIKQNMELQNTMRELIPHLGNNNSKKNCKKVLPEIKLDKTTAS